MPKANHSQRQRPGHAVPSGLLLALLLGFAMLFSNIVHAAEQMCAPMPASAILEGDSTDQIAGAQSADGHAQGDSGSLHQHGGCHGHHLASASSGAETELPFATPSLQITTRNAHLAQAPPESLLRPPTA